MHKIVIIKSNILFFILLNKNWILYFIKLHKIKKILCYIYTNFIVE